MCARKKPPCPPEGPTRALRKIADHEPVVINFASEVDEATLDQAHLTASMPFVYPHVALMPDAHFGKGSSVGTVFGTTGAIIPAAVGVDIGCGMIGVRTQFTTAELEGKDLTILRDSIEAAIPLSPGNYNTWHLGESAEARVRELATLAEETNVDLSHSPQVAPAARVPGWRQPLHRAVPG